MRLASLFVVAGSVVMLASANPIYKEIAHSIGYDNVIAANAAVAASSDLRGLIDALGAIDQFKPIIHPDVVDTINSVETFRGLLSALIGYYVKKAVRNFYTGDYLNDTPYIGELIRNADAMIAPEYKQVISSIEQAQITQVS
ncbi:hypothetical protein IWW38_000209 [Coemansia aciculifera]|uniref:Uncharacterized protein n=1 Tax=Coemansia aciculifera TaxID=417176 RepID=A0ACC1M9F9_9FUNG|nr:hypothetical protein IWW38_000209 [Coemansia aciculifera]